MIQGRDVDGLERTSSRASYIWVQGYVYMRMQKQREDTVVPNTGKEEETSAIQGPVEEVVGNYQHGMHDKKWFPVYTKHKTSGASQGRHATD